MAKEFIAQGGFNTGRLYRAEGQRIFWAQRADGWVYFNDIDRMISGWLEPLLIGQIFPRDVMREYDAGKYEFYPDPMPEGRPPSVPDGFDFGPMLRI